MAKTICIIGALDTKGLEFAFLKAEIEKEAVKRLRSMLGCWKNRSTNRRYLPLRWQMQAVLRSPT